MTSLLSRPGWQGMALRVGLILSTAFVTITITGFLLAYSGFGGSGFVLLSLAIELLMFAIGLVLLGLGLTATRTWVQVLLIVLGLFQLLASLVGLASRAFG